MQVPKSWVDVRRCFSVASIILGGVSIALPETYAKIGLALGLALANVATFIKTEESPSAKDTN